MEQKEIEIKVLPDGTVEIDLIGYKGQGCDVDLKKITKSLGIITDSKKKSDFYQDDPKGTVSESE